MWRLAGTTGAWNLRKPRGSCRNASWRKRACCNHSVTCAEKEILQTPAQNQGCGTVTFLVGSGSGEAFRLRVKLFGGSGSGSEWNEWNEWMNEWMKQMNNEWMNEWNEWMKQMNEWMKPMNEWMEQMNEWNKWTNEMNEWMNEWNNFFFNKFSPNPLIGRIGKDRALLSRACCAVPVIYFPIAQFRVYGRI